MWPFKKKTKQESPEYDRKNLLCPSCGNFSGFAHTISVDQTRKKTITDHHHLCKNCGKEWSWQIIS